MRLQAGVRCLRLLLGAGVFRRRSARCRWEHRERVSAAGGRHEGLQPIAVEPKQGLDQAKSKVQLLFGLLAPAFTPRTAQGMPREEATMGAALRGRGVGRWSRAAAADVLGQLCLLAFWKGTLCLEAFPKQFEVN